MWNENIYCPKRMVFFLLLILSCCFTQANIDKFFGANYKLSNSHVNNVYQDKKGYIWVCTENGLNVFNSIGFKTYYHQEGDTTSLMNNSVLTVLEDSKGYFWVGTTGGLQLFNRETEKFSVFHLAYSNITDFSYISCIIEDSKGNIWLSTSRSGIVCIKAGSHKPIYYMQTNSNICSNKINVIFEDRFGNIWAGSQDNGVSVLNLDNHTVVNYGHDAGDPSSLSSDKVFSIIQSQEGQILVGTIDGGIDAFDYTSRSFKRNSIPLEDMIFTMTIDSKNNLWIGTDGQGIKKYNFETKELIPYESEYSGLNLKKAKIHRVFEDRQGNLWLALYQKGVMMLPQKQRFFNNIGFNAFYPNKSIGTDCVLAIMQDRNKDVWVGTDGDGLYRLGSNREVKQIYRGNKLAANTVLSIFQDSKGRIWIGTYLYGLLQYNASIDQFEAREILYKGKAIKHINTIEEDREGNLWLGTNENGVCIYNPEIKDTKFLTYDLMKSKDQLLSNSVNTITFDKLGRAWIGTSGLGLSCYDPSKNTFTDYSYENKQLSNNNIFVVVEDEMDNIWVGTNQGLNCINLAKNTTKHYTNNNGLPNNAISGIVVDERGDLWISTCLGLSHFNVTNEKFTNYFLSDGIINDEFRRGAYYRTSEGEIFFGGINGITSFYPFSQTSSHSLLNLVFTDFYIYNESVDLRNKENSVLAKVVDFSNEVRLEHSIKSFSIGFTALEYNQPDKVVYQIKMEGFEDDWRTLPLGSKLATYTNLKPGKYIFKVKAHLEGTDELERELVIIINPPFWATWWAKTFYIILLLGILFVIYRELKERMKRKDEDVRKENESHIMQSKLQFFTDISHEIRTPLTLILTPVQQLLKETTDGPLKDTYKLINQNGQRILRLVNQVMEMRKLDRGQVSLLAEETDVEEFFKEIMNSFIYVAQEKGIDFSFEIEENLPKVWIDQEKLDKVIFNVLSNAFKYTLEGGAISIKVDTSELNLRIKISDSGIGIPEEQRELIFDRFYQVENSNNRNTIGTGIGLHLSRSLMEIHNGKIYVGKTEGVGTTFIIELPIDNNYLKAEERKYDRSERNLATLVQPSLASFDNDLGEQILPASNKQRYKLLVVEDDQDIKKYLKEILNKEYQIIEAENGLIGLEKAIKEQPDCVITDVMMPEMDGIDMCDKIKKNDATSHIPVIILTAKTAIEQRVEGLQVGADSYIPKPFNIDHLRTRISKLIELRRKMKDKFEGKNEIKQEDLNVKTADEKFLDKLTDIVKNKMADSDLSVEVISKEIGISRSQLQRKLKQLTNQNPSDYIKTTRLRHAAWLLSTKNLTISEVTYATGFSSLSHFSNSFREYYGMSPSRYMEINNNRSEHLSDE